MKINSPFVHRLGGLLASCAVRNLMSTLEYKCSFYDPTVDPVNPQYAGQKIYIFWHEYILLPALAVGHPDLAVLISKHADGQLLESLMESSGIGLVHGSTNRGGVEAVRQLVNGTIGRRFLGVSPDGPRGPRRVLQPGIIYIAFFRSFNPQAGQLRELDAIAAVIIGGGSIFGGYGTVLGALAGAAVIALIRALLSLQVLLPDGKSFVMPQHWISVFIGLILIVAVLSDIWLRQADAFGAIRRRLAPRRAAPIGESP